MGMIQNAINGMAGSVDATVNKINDTKEQKRANDLAAENNKLNAISAADKLNTATYDALAQHNQNFKNEIGAQKRYNEARDNANNKHPKDAKTGKFVRYDAQKAMEALHNAKGELEMATKQRELSYQRIKGLVANRDALMKANKLDANYLTKEAAELKPVNNVADALYEFERGGK